MSNGILFLIGLTIVFLFILALIVVALRFDERKNRAPQIATAARQILEATERARQDVARFESAVRNVAGALSSSPVASSADSSVAGEETARSTGGGGLPGSSAMTPADRTAGHPRYKFLRYRGDGAARD